jgi:hypothetical protein
MTAGVIAGLGSDGRDEATSWCSASPSRKIERHQLIAKRFGGERLSTVTLKTNG